MKAEEGKQYHYKENKSFEGDLTVIAASGDPLGCTAK